MCWSSITGLTCLLCWVAMSAGWVSPPENLSVTFLDFMGEVKWSPGKGNPPGTTYTVELQPTGRKEWSQLETCTNIQAKTCPFPFNLSMDALMRSYYIRVKASWRGNSSNWTGLHTVQPYGDTLLSAPTLNMSVQDREIHVHVHMPQLVLSVLPDLKYKVLVSESNSSDQEECSMLRPSSYVCRSLNLGQWYCVNASAIHKQQQTEPHLSSKKCVNLPGISVMPIHIAIITTLLLMVIIILIITFMRIYMKPRASDSYTPSSLEAVGGAAWTLMAIPTEIPPLLSLINVTTPSLSSSSIMLEEYQSSCNWGYECRGLLSCPEQTADHPSLPADEEEPEELPPNPYSGILDEDKQGNGILQGETRNTQLRLEKMDWQLDPGIPGCLDVPMSSLTLCMNTGEPWEDCGGSEGVGKEGEEMDVEAKLRGLSQRNSAGNLSTSVETLNEQCPLHKSDSSPTCSAGYEPRANPHSHEPISAACPPSPMFGQSVLYLRR